MKKKKKMIKKGIIKINKKKIPLINKKYTASFYFLKK
jgi:hypothetical protein